MKKLIAFLLITVYVFATAGTTIAMHYCMGDPVGATLGYSEQQVCEFCHMEKHSGEDMSHCCKDDHQFVKVSADQDLSVKTASPKMPVATISFFECHASVALMADAMVAFEKRMDPPDIPVFQRNCNFRI